MVDILSGFVFGSVNRQGRAFFRLCTVFSYILFGLVFFSSVESLLYALSGGGWCEGVLPPYGSQISVGVARLCASCVLREQRVLTRNYELSSQAGVEDVGLGPEPPQLHSWHCSAESRQSCSKRSRSDGKNSCRYRALLPFAMVRHTHNLRADLG